MHAADVIDHDLVAARTGDHPESAGGPCNQDRVIAGTGFDTAHAGTGLQQIGAGGGDDGLHRAHLQDAGQAAVARRDAQDSVGIQRAHQCLGQRGEIEDVARTRGRLGAEVEHERGGPRQSTGAHLDDVVAFAPGQALDRQEAVAAFCKRDGEIGLDVRHGGGCGVEGDGADAGVIGGIEAVVGVGQGWLAAVADVDARRGHAGVIAAAAVELVRDGDVQRAKQTVIARTGHHGGKARRGLQPIGPGGADQVSNPGIGRPDDGRTETTS